MTDFNIETATLQEAVDYAVQKIVEQGGRCMPENATICAYRDGDNHCAVGWLLPHDNEELMEFYGDVNQLILYHDEAYEVPTLVRLNSGPLKNLQRFHDYTSKSARISQRAKLNIDHGIDVSGEWFDAWVEMAEDA